MKQIILTLAPIFLGQFTMASYEETSRRYLTNHEIVQALESIVPLKGTCSTDNLAKEGSSLGANTALTGQPISPTPGQSTVALITRCLDESMRSLSWRDPIVVKLIGNENVEALENTKNAFNIWSKYSEQTQKNIIATMVYNILGSDETIKDFDIIEPEVLRNKIFVALNRQPHILVSDVVTFITVNLVLRDEFLSY